MGRRPLPPRTPPLEQSPFEVDRLVLGRQGHRGAPRGEDNSGSGGSGHPGCLPRLSARRRDPISRGGALPEIRGHGQVRPSPGFRGAWTAECGGHLARSEPSAQESRPPLCASPLLGTLGAARAPEPRRAARAWDRDPPRRPHPSPVSRSRPLSARPSLAPRRAPLTPGRVFCSCSALWAFSADSRSQ